MSTAALLPRRVARAFVDHCQYPELGVNKGGHRLRGGQSGDKRDKRDAGEPASCRLAKRNRFFRLKPLYDKSKQHECCDVEAEQRTDIVALHQAKPDTDAG